VEREEQRKSKGRAKEEQRKSKGRAKERFDTEVRRGAETE
jgi:hypothetical protein